MRRATGFVEAEPGEDGDGDGKGDQRKRVWSSDPEIRSSGVVRKRLSYRALAKDWAGR